jgi:hypothetical protein
MTTRETRTAATTRTTGTATMALRDPDAFLSVTDDAALLLGT